MAIRYCVYDTGIGDVTVLAEAKALTGLFFGAIDPPGCLNEENTMLYDAIMELNQYFYGQRKVLDLRVNPQGTDLEKQAWDYIVKNLPYGKRMTYKEVAVAIGHPREEKAVEKAMLKNPIPLFIPCHRVVSSDKDIGDYVAGREFKEKILNMERINADREFVVQDYEDD